MKPQRTKERRWLVFNNGCIHGVQHSELVVVRSSPNRSIVHDSVAVFTISKTFTFITVLAVVTALVLLLAGCQVPRAQKGGSASTIIRRAGQTNTVTLTQSDNPKEPSQQKVQSEQTIEYVLPAGTAVGLSLEEPRGVDRTSKLEERVSRTPNSDLLSPYPAPRTPNSDLLSANSYLLSRPMPVKHVIKDRTETQIGGAQKDTLREWAAKARAMQPVMWTGVGMMTVVAGVLVYFGWWTKAAVAIMIGLAMVALAGTLPDHGTMILLGG